MYHKFGWEVLFYVNVIPSRYNTKLLFNYFVIFYPPDIPLHINTLYIVAYICVSGDICTLYLNICCLFQSAYFVNLLIGGYDAEEQGSLYYMDYLASSVKVPFTVHGYGAMFVLGLLDRYYHDSKWWLNIIAVILSTKTFTCTFDNHWPLISWLCLDFPPALVPHVTCVYILVIVITLCPSLSSPCVWFLLPPIYVVILK